MPHFIPHLLRKGEEALKSLSRSLANYVHASSSLGEFEATIRDLVSVLSDELSPPVLALPIASQIWTLMTEISLHELSRLVTTSQKHREEQQEISPVLMTLLTDSMVPRCVEEERDQLSEKIEQIVGRSLN